MLVRSRRRIIANYRPLVVAESLVLYGETVVAVGNYEDMKNALAGSDYTELESEYVLAPGFVDAHAHPDSLGYNLVLGGKMETSSVKDVLEKLGESRVVAGWVVPPRIDPSSLREGRMPYYWEIDAYVRDKPVLIQHISGHMASLNSVGIALAREVLGQIRFGDLEKGWLYEEDLWRLLTHIRSSMREPELEEALLLGLREFESKGVTAVGAAGLSFREVEALKRLDKEGKLPIRVYGYVIYTGGPDFDYDYVEKLLYETWGDRSSRFRINGLKVILDGALGPRTAYLSSDYSDEPGRRGFLNYNEEELEKVFAEASRRNLQVAVHVIGDAALEVALRVARRVRDLYLRLEHVSLVRDDQLGYIKELGPVLVVQPHFVISDKWMTQRVGCDRIRWVYRFKELADVAVTAYSTDAPVEPVDPFETVYAAVTRGLYDDVDYARASLRNAVTVAEALAHYTVDAGLALGDPRLGCLLPGCYADIVELSDDPLLQYDPVKVRGLKASVVKLIKGSK
ncbi:Amidohydrolase 3 [Thermogladius calderae 1633]|uniref:Amidohydrolase 3 n=1 Tax=Thermogladius calderae (strain DSM 22663 / VKM B-2946 / 1633) TaxID=1184251 RepID=I3TEV6_THEC1|nr:amidohydrolase family protein [Thermogladius calderae]AFK51294.1 Amidohydrolase 3 [Thermogladius calderae 1633]